MSRQVNTDTGAGADGEQTDPDGRSSDPRSLVLPYVDTAADLAEGRFKTKVTGPRLLLITPTVLLTLAGAWTAFTGGSLILAALCVGLAGAVGFAALAGEHLTGWAFYPHEHVLNVTAYLRRRARLPIGGLTALHGGVRTHGIDRGVRLPVETSETARPESYAGVVTDDGRLVVPIRLDGANAAILPEGDLGRRAGALTTGIDTQLADALDATFTFYATTRPARTTFARTYLERAGRWWNTTLTEYESALLGKIGEWVADEDGETPANETRHYLFVSTDCYGDDDTDRAKTRVEAAVNAITRSRDYDTGPLTPREVTNLVADYWERETFPAEPAGDDAHRALIRPDALAPNSEGDKHVAARGEGPGVDAIQGALAPDHFAEHTQHVEIGEEVARTLYVESFPVQPTVGFMDALDTLGNVDLDMAFHARPVDRDWFGGYLNTSIARVDGEATEREEQGTADSITIEDDIDAYVLAQRLHESVGATPWELSGFITVRAPDTDTLRKAVTQIEKAAKSPPSPLSLRTASYDQALAFRSSAPFGRDEFSERGRRKYRRRKTHYAYSGVLGARLPDPTPDHSGNGTGIRWGRDVTTNRTIEADPFDQGLAPHMLTVGPSGSGKTVSVKQASQEWWLNGDDRTLIYADTQGGFEDVVDAFDATHLVIDGETCINPLDIRPAADHDLKATGGGYDQYRLAVDGATEFFAGLLQNHGVDPSTYYSAIEHGIEQTYARAGITADSATHGHETPTPVNVFETWERMLENPAEYTFTDVDVEAEKFRDRIAELLNELSGFKEGGKYHSMMAETTAGISPDDRIVYIDMRQLAGQTGGASSVNLQAAVSQVGQVIKQTPGETLFIPDEAHNLLHSPAMVDWLNKAAREWRRHNAGIWFVTQSPQEFVRRAEGVDAGGENKRETILEQCSIRQIMHAGGIDDGVLSELGIPPHATRTVKDDLVPGSAGEGFSECVLSFRDEPGWIRTKVEAAPTHLASLTFTHRESEDYFDRVVDAARRAQRDRDGGQGGATRDVAETPHSAAETTMPDEIDPVLADGRGVSNGRRDGEDEGEGGD